MAMGSRTGRIAGGVAAVVTGVMVLGAEPVPAPQSKAEQLAAADAAIAKVLPTARLFRMTVTGTVPSPVNGAEMCLGPESMRKFAGLVADNPEAVAALGKGCAQTREKKADGSMRVEVRCDKASGAVFTGHMVLEGTMKDIHQHQDMVLDLGAGEPKTYSTDTHMTEVGPCPATMKSGQIRTADGQIIDPLAALAALGATHSKAGPEKGGVPAK